MQCTKNNVFTDYFVNKVPLHVLKYRTTGF